MKHLLNIAMGVKNIKARGKVQNAVFLGQTPKLVTPHIYYIDLVRKMSILQSAILITEFDRTPLGSPPPKKKK